MVAVDDLEYTGVVPMMPRGARGGKRHISKGRKRRLKRRELQKRLQEENEIDRRTVTCLLDNDGEIVIRAGFDLSDAFAGVAGKSALSSKKDRAEVRASVEEKHRRCALVSASLTRLRRRREVEYFSEMIDGQVVDVYLLVNDS